MPSTRHLLLCALLLSLPAPSAHADATLAQRIQTLLSTTDAAAQATQITALVAQAPEFEEVYRRLQAGRRYEARPETGWVQLLVTCTDGVQRDHLAWIPPDYDAGRRYPLLVELHGGVSRPTLRSDASTRQIDQRIARRAREHKAIILLPKAQKGAEWWSKTGAANVLAAIAQLKRRYNIDENRVAVGGFSDGGSGSYFFALSAPTPFAAAVPLNGHVAVAGIGLQVYLRNLVNRPLYVVNTGKDTLYPAAQITPYVAAMRTLGATRLVYRTFDEIPHAPLYMDDEGPKIWRWLTAQVREPHPKRLVWETADPAHGRIHWLAITRVGDQPGPHDGFRDVVPTVTRSRVTIGINIERAFAGPGVKISQVAKGTLAERVGLRVGDVIVAMDGAPIDGLPALRAALGAKKPGDAVAFAVQRGAERPTFKDRFKPTVSRPAFARTRPSGAVTAVVEGNTITLTTANVRQLRLELSPAQVDLARPVTIVVNGTQHSQRVHSPDVRVLLETAVRDDDRSMLYGARVTLDLPAASK